MPLGDTLLRSLQRIGSSPHSASEIERVGALGEAVVADEIVPAAGRLIVYNPLVPHPCRPGAWLESDLLVYTHGKLFCIEVKNYSGAISYPPGQWGAEGAGIVQTKYGRFGDVLDTKGMRQNSEHTRAYVRVGTWWCPPALAYTASNTAHTSPHRSTKSRRWSARETVPFRC
jgi:hypothetical protein